MAVMRIRTAEDFTFMKKPFYTPSEVASILGISTQTVLDRIHDADDRRRLYAVQLGVHTYRVPLGSLLQLLGVEPIIEHSKSPNLVQDAVKDE